MVDVLSEKPSVLFKSWRLLSDNFPLEVVARQEVLKVKGLLNWRVWTCYCHTIKRSKGEGRCHSFDVPCLEITWSEEGLDSAAGYCCSSDNSFISYATVIILPVSFQFPIIQPTGGYSMELAGNSTGNFFVAQQSACILAFITTERLSNCKHIIMSVQRADSWCVHIKGNSKLIFLSFAVKLFHGRVRVAVTTQDITRQ